eukprot:732728-Pelagomonas_calceolata.AAC.1
MGLWPQRFTLSTNKALTLLACACRMWRSLVGWNASSGTMSCRLLKKTYSACMCMQDVDMISWMERELRRNELAVVLVTHDSCCPRTRCLAVVVHARQSSTGLLPVAAKGYQKSYRPLQAQASTRVLLCACQCLLRRGAGIHNGVVVRLSVSFAQRRRHQQRCCCAPVSVFCAMAQASTTMLLCACQCLLCKGAGINNDVAVRLSLIVSVSTSWKMCVTACWSWTEGAASCTTLGVLDHMSNSSRSHLILRCLSLGVLQGGTSLQLAPSSH